MVFDMEMECPDCGGSGSSWLWARSNDEAKHLIRSLEDTIQVISLDHDLGGHDLNPDDPQTFYFKGSVEDDGRALAVWLVENGLMPPNIEIHSWNPTGVERILNVFKAADAAGTLTGHSLITIKRAQEPA